MHWGLGVCENIDTPTCISPYLISGISSSLPLDVGQKSNHVNPWYSLFVCLFIFSGRFKLELVITFYIRFCYNSCESIAKNIVNITLFIKKYNCWD